MEQTIKYAVTAPKRPGSLVTFEYDLEGKLVSVRFNPDAAQSFKLLIGSNLPVQRDWLKAEVFAGCEIKQINDLDISFSAFWESYGYKLGHKARVAKKWGQLTNEDKIQALGFIRRYRNFCDRKKIELCYPETYLNQRRWENQID